MHINIFIYLLDAYKYNKLDFNTVVNDFFESGEKTGDFLAKNIRQLLNSLLKQSKTMDNWIEREIKNLICYLDLFQKLIDSKIVDFSNNTIILKNDDTLCDFIKCNSTLMTPIILFDWYELSSGEKSLLSFYSRFYDLVRKKQIKKEYILILIDELDTCFHPEWQRQIISYIINICHAFFENKHVKVIVTSNSPFIASDLPSNNIIFLQNHTNMYNEFEATFLTFGSNIHTLYAKASFMNNGLVGEFARQKINNIIEMIKPSSEKNTPN